MAPTEDRDKPTLPVTAEVGDEGGSFAEPTQQTETFSGPAGNPRVDPKAVEAGVKSPPVHFERIPTSPKDDGVKAATEKPDDGSC